MSFWEGGRGGVADGCVVGVNEEGKRTNAVVWGRQWRGDGGSGSDAWRKGLMVVEKRRPELWVLVVGESRVVLNLEHRRDDVLSFARCEGRSRGCGEGLTAAFPTGSKDSGGMLETRISKKACLSEGALLMLDILMKSHFLGTGSASSKGWMKTGL